MPQGITTRPSGAIRLMTLACALAIGAGPATAPSLPAGGVRRMGDQRYPVDGFRAGRPAVSPDGRSAAAADTGGASVWDVATGDRTAVVRPDARPGRLAFGVAYLSADTLAVACADPPVPPRSGTVTLFLADPVTGRVRGQVDLADTGRPVAVPGDRGPGILATTLPFDLVASPDGRRVAFRVGRQGILLYDAVTGRRVADLTPPSVPVIGPRAIGVGVRPAAVHFGGGGRGVTLDGAGQATVFDDAIGARVGGRSFPADRAATVSADGRTLATVGGGAVHLFDLADGHELDPLPAGPPAARPAGAAFAPAGGWLAVTRSNPPASASVEVVDTAATPPRSVARCDVPQRAAADPIWSADGRVFVLEGATAGLVAFDAATGRPLSPRSTVADRATALAVDPDGRSVVIGDAAGRVRRWDVQTGQLRADPPQPPPADRIGGPVTDLRYVTDDAGTVTLSASAMRQLWLSDPQTLAVRAHVGGPPPSAGWPDAYSPDGRRAARVGTDAIDVVDLGTGRTLVTAPLGEATATRDGPPWPQQVSFSDDGRSLLVRTARGFRLLDVAGGRAGPFVPSRGLNSLCLSPDGRLLAAAGGPVTRLYSTAAGPAPQLLWTAPTAQTSREPTFDDAGRWLAIPAATTDPRTNGEDLTVYESATGRPILTLPTGGLDSRVRFVPHHPLYVTTEVDGTAVVRSVRAALTAAPAGRSDDLLWADLAAPDPAVAYRAGFALDDRGQLVPRSRSSAAAPVRGPDWTATVGDLSSPDRTKREAAHKRLEAAGPDAGGAVRRALAAHPGGEAEARLTDLARLAGDAPVPPAAPATSADVRRERVAQLLDWSADPAAPAELARLAGRPATTRP